MKKWLLFCCFSVSLGARPTANRAQVAGNGPVQESLLKMEILLPKETYRSTEDISTATSFLNLSDKTLCFPKPAQEQINSVQGFLSTKVIAPVGDGDAEMFIDVVDTRGTWPRDKLVQEIKSKWVKLLPGHEYATESAQLKQKFDRPGEWQVQRTYSPPHGSAQYREMIQSASAIVGCTVPLAKVSTETVTITIVPHSGME